MKPYVSLFTKDNNEGHSSMPRREINSYISVYDQNFNSCRSSRKNMNQNQGNVKNAKTAIPQKNASIKESVEEKSTKNEIHPIIVINIMNGGNVRDVIRDVFNSF